MTISSLEVHGHRKLILLKLLRCLNLNILYYSIVNNEHLREWTSMNCDHYVILTHLITKLSGLVTNTRLSFLTPWTSIIVFNIFTGSSRTAGAFLTKRVAVSYSTYPVKRSPNPSGHRVVAVPASSISNLFTKRCNRTLFTMYFVQILILFQNFILFQCLRQNGKKHNSQQTSNSVFHCYSSSIGFSNDLLTQ